MSEVTMRKCDECGAVHGAVNNWWCVIGKPDRPLFLTFEQTELEYAEAFRLDYCSHKCVGTAFHRWLDTGDVRALVARTTDEEREYAVATMA
jgi:hypothetical protein